MKALQLAVLIALTVVALSLIPLVWIGVAPEQGFLSFLGSVNVLAPIGAVAGSVAAVWAFVLGWDPTQVALKRLRKWLVERIFSSRKSMRAILFVCALSFGGVACFLVTADDKVQPSIVDLLLAEDFDGAGKQLGSSKLSSARLTDLRVVTNALQQEVLLQSQAADEEECRIHLNYLENRRVAFRPLWWRHLFALSRAACLHVVGNPSEASLELQRDLTIADRLSDEEVRRVWRAIARIQLVDKTGEPKERTPRLRNVIRIVSADRHKAARRMEGSAYFELGEYTKAIEVWERSLAGQNEALEKKKLFNNLVIGYSAIAQYQQARELARQGIELPFDENVESERREQVRLLGTSAYASVHMGSCAEADDAWNRREALKRQERSTCTALLEAQVYSCRVKGASFPALRKEKIIDALVFGTQKKNAMVELTPVATAGLLKEAESRFGHCYLGLKFATAPVKAALSIP